MLHVSTPEPSAFASEPAGRWFGLAESLLASGRILQDVVQQQLGSSQLSPSQLSILWACAAAPSSRLGQKELAARLAFSPAQVSGLVEQLRREQLLESHRDPADRRCQFWHITPTGRAALEAVFRDLADWSRGLEQSLGNELADVVQVLLAQVVRAVGRHETVAAPTEGPGPSIQPVSHRGAA